MKVRSAELAGKMAPSTGIFCTSLGSWGSNRDPRDPTKLTSDLHVYIKAHAYPHTYITDTHIIIINTTFKNVFLKKKSRGNNPR